MIERFNIQSLIRNRADQKSFHMAAEKYVRIEFHNMRRGDSLGPFAYQGNVILTCYRGAFRIETAADTVELAEFDQAVLPPGERTRLTSVNDGTLQLIWSPPYAPATQG
jgi:hypothetical protein